MKRYFIAGLVIVLALSLGAILYGAWLNERGEFQIARRMEERRLTLRGARAEVRPIRTRIVANALNLYSNDMADAVALVDGRILESRAPKGSRVRQGDTLFVLQNEDIPLQIQEAESNILQAQANLRRAENNYHRYQILKASDAASAQQYDDAEATYYSAEAALRVSQAKLEQLRVQEARQEVKAPIDGRVLVQYRQQGAYVQAGTSLALVGNFDHLYFTASVEDKDARRLSHGMEAELVFRSKDFKKVYGTDYAAGNLGSSQVFTAVVTEIRPPLSEPAAMRSVLWQVDNHSGLLEPQTYGGVSFQARRSHNALTVPLSALSEGNEKSVFVVREDGTVERRGVMTGTTDGTYIEVLSGLSEGEVVVSSGTEGLVDGTLAEIVMDYDEPPRESLHITDSNSLRSQESVTETEGGGAAR